MNILIISDAWHPQVNGVVRTYEHLKEELEKQGHQVTVIGPQDFKNRIPMPGYREIELVLFPQKQLIRKIKAIQPDNIHIATEGPLGCAARHYCLKNDIVFSSCYHSQFPTYFAMRLSKYIPFLFNFFHAIGARFIRRFHNASGALFVTTQSMADDLIKWGVTAPIYPLTRGINNDVFTIGQKDLFQDLKKPIALYVGRLAIEKNVEEFLSMDWHGSKVVVGHGPEYDRLIKQYPDTHFLGKKTGLDLGDCYRAADVFVFPSYTDTFGIVLIEALACGLPIAAHDVIGPKDVVTEDFLGALDKDLSTAAQKALTNGTAKQREAYVHQHYTWEKAAKQFLNTKEKLKKIS